MKKIHLLIWSFVVLSLIVLGACSTVTSVPTATPLPATAVPPTATPLPTTTAVATEVVEAPIPTAMPNPPRTFIIDGTQSIARYRVDEEFLSGAVTALGKELGFFTAVGWTRAIEGLFQLEETEAEGLSLASGEITVEIRTLQSDESRRDQRIREQYLQSSLYPQAEFTVTGVEGFPENYTEGEDVTFFLTGDMTIREITNSETFTITANLEGDTITGTGVTQIFMVDYGFDPPEIAGYLVAQDPATIEIELVATEGEPVNE